MPILSSSVSITMMQLIYSDIYSDKHQLEEDCKQILLYDLSKKLPHYVSFYVFRDPKTDYITHKGSVAICNPSLFEEVVAYLKDRAKDDEIARKLCDRLEKEV